MIKKFKHKKKIKNQGNTFIMVVATLSFLAVLVATLLVAVALCYRLKAYDINARDNFYYLEQAMDEIYAGVGADAMVHLNTAYDDTIEVLVYFDAGTQSYVTMKNEDANRIMKNTYMKLVKDDSDYANTTTIKSHFETFLSNVYDATNNTDGVLLSVGNIDKSSDDEVVIKNLVLKREAVYSTVNARSAEDGTVGAGDTFVQTITTDLVISKPEFDVNFNTIESDLNEVYKYAFVADKGVEIGNATTRVNITGNIYAASDFYNKDYNITDTDHVNYIPRDPSDEAEMTKYAAVSSTDSSDADGKQEKSMYSGLYIDGADVIIFADRIIVPGTIAAFNSADLTVSGLTGELFNSTEIWADGVVLGGYSLISDPREKTVKGSHVKLRANAYIADDLELNAKASEFTMVGQYYGYNYASLDNRTYTDACVDANGGRSYVDTVTSEGIRDGATIEGQAHYNSSAIIVNGEGSSLDLSSVSNMYIAGQAYIETSKKTTVQDKVRDANGQDTDEDYTVTNKNGENEVVTRNHYDYPTYKTDDEGEIVDDYTQRITEDVNGNSTEETSNIQDYRTGEAISLKSNQLAYIPNWAVTETDEGLFVSVPAHLQSSPLLKEFWDDGDDQLDIISKIPVVKSVISGKTYYFFDFSTDATKYNNNVTDAEVDVMNRFIEAYAEMFELSEGETISEGEAYQFTDITDYEHFKVEMLQVNTKKDFEASGDDYANIYSNSAITVKDGTSFTIKADSSSIKPLTTAANNINANVREKNYHLEDGETAHAEVATSGQTAFALSTGVTTALQSQYKEVKWTLTPQSTNWDAVQDAHDMEESDITPINYFFKFNMLSDNWEEVNIKLASGYQVWISSGDVHVDAKNFDDGNVKGMIICKGDVTFDNAGGTDNGKSYPAVQSFEGLIVSGSKVKVEHSMNFTANEEIIKTILRECDQSQYDENNNYYRVCEIFQHYQSVYKKNTSGSEIETESMKSISAVQFEDILSFDNWNKNVD